MSPNVDQHVTTTTEVHADDRRIGVGLSVVAAGLWSGLLLTLTTILHPTYAARDGKGFAEDMRRFLPVARRSPTNYVLVLTLLIAPIVALIGLWQQKSGAPFILTAIGLGLPSPVRC